MAVAPTYPGVYIEEVPSGVHTITGVATSITAFVGYTARGAVDNAVHIFSFADFERALRRPHDRQPAEPRRQALLPERRHRGVRRARRAGRGRPHR